MEIKKLCNIFSESAETEDITLDFGLFKHDVNKTVDTYKKKHGGIWVGGKFTISNDIFSFSTNEINKALHTSDADLVFSLNDVKRVWREFGWISGILNFELEDRIIKVRCIGAKKVAQQINAYLQNRP